MSQDKPVLTPVRASAQTVERFRACGVCGVRDIPFGVAWECWHDGRPCHPACYPINEPPQVGHSVTAVPDPYGRTMAGGLVGYSEQAEKDAAGPASGSPDEEDERG